MGNEQLYIEEEPVRVDIPLPPPILTSQQDEFVNGGDGMTAYKNIEMEQMLASLEKFLDRIDKIGYAAARNTRILRSETKEYFDRRQQLVEKYGKPQLDEEGNPTGLTELRFDSPEFLEYAKEIEEWALIEHSPNLFKLKFEEAIGQLSGSELLEIEWMFED